MLDSGQSEVFVSNILKDTQVTRQALNEISARHSEIQQLERSIRELHEIFTFLATEVEMQGEMINRIEKNILSSADYVERGQEHVKKALENQKKARKVSLQPWPQPQVFLSDFPDSSSPTEKSHDCHLCVHHCSHPSCHHWHHHSSWIMLLILGEIWWACPVPGTSLPASPQTLFSLLPLQIWGIPGTGAWPSLPAAVGAGQSLQLDPCPDTGPCAKGQMVFSGLTAAYSVGPPPSGHDAWGRACSVLFDWDTWFCKKIKKSWRPLCMCIPRRIGPGLPLSSFPPPGHSWGQAQSDRLRSECPRCCDHSGLALSVCSPTEWVECVGKRFCLAPSSYCAPTVST